MSIPLVAGSIAAIVLLKGFQKRGSLSQPMANIYDDFYEIDWKPPDLPVPYKPFPQAEFEILMEPFLFGLDKRYHMMVIRYKGEPIAMYSSSGTSSKESHRQGQKMMWIPTGGLQYRDKGFTWSRPEHRKVFGGKKFVVKFIQKIGKMPDHCHPTSGSPICGKYVGGPTAEFRKEVTEPLGQLYPIEDDYLNYKWTKQHVPRFADITHDKWKEFKKTNGFWPGLSMFYKQATGIKDDPAESGSEKKRRSRFRTKAWETYASNLLEHRLKSLGAWRDEGHKAWFPVYRVLYPGLYKSMPMKRRLLGLK